MTLWERRYVVPGRLGTAVLGYVDNLQETRPARAEATLFT
jgi:hypothetical protein